MQFVLVPLGNARYTAHVPSILHAGARTAHRIAVERSDRRWLVAWTAVFLLLCTLMLGAYDIYAWTGPHPQVTALVRRLKHDIRWLTPGLKTRPHAS